MPARTLKISIKTLPSHAYCKYPTLISLNIFAKYNAIDKLCFSRCRRLQCPWTQPNTTHHWTTTWRSSPPSTSFRTQRRPSCRGSRRHQNIPRNKSKSGSPRRDSNKASAGLLRRWHLFHDRKIDWFKKHMWAFSLDLGCRWNTWISHNAWCCIYS